MEPFTLDRLKAKLLIAQPVEAFDSLCHVAELGADEQDKRIHVPWTNRKSRLGMAEDDNSGFRAFIVAAALCDAERKYLAANTQEINDLADKLGEASSREVTRLAVVVSQINGMGDAVVEAIEKK